MIRTILELVMIIGYTYAMAALIISALVFFVIAPVVSLKNEFSCKYLEEDAFVQRGLTKIGAFLASLVLIGLCLVVVFSFGRTIKFNNDITNHYSSQITEESSGYISIKKDFKIKFEVFFFDFNLLDQC